MTRGLAADQGESDLRPGGGLHYAWVMAGMTFLALLSASGVRSSFGVFIKPMEREFGWDRATLSLAASLSLFLFGAVGPLMGRVVDRFGPRPVLSLGVLLVGLAAVGSGLVQQLWQLYLITGILMAVGTGAAATVTASAVAARWFVKRRALVMGIASAGMSAGQLIVLPFAMSLTLNYGWRQAWIILGVVLAVLVFPVLLGVLRNDPEDTGRLPYGADPSAAVRAAAAASAAAERPCSVGEAARTQPFRMLVLGFFICGYTSGGLPATHLVPFIMERGFSPMTAANAVALMGAMNVVGTLLSGWICDRYGRKKPLASYYFFRGLALLFLLVLWDTPSLYFCMVILGLNYIATVPPTSTLIADLYGRRSAGTLFGWVFLSHQVGAALGAFLGGYLHDLTGNYTLAFFSGGILAVVAAGLSLAIREGRPAVPRTLPSAAAAPATY
ncbi:MAG: MFS transporter [Deltaproteobacteria bacterium]|nr:MFS transporter [Deltaproteobacteria bacterium]